MTNLFIYSNHHQIRDLLCHLFGDGPPIWGSLYIYISVSKDSHYGMSINHVSTPSALELCTGGQTRLVYMGRFEHRGYPEIQTG